MKKIIASLVSIADELDELGYLPQSDAVTNIAIRLCKDNKDRKVYAQVGGESQIEYINPVAETTAQAGQAATPQPAATEPQPARRTRRPTSAANQPLSYQIGLDPATLQAIQELLVLLLAGGGAATAATAATAGAPQQAAAPVGPVPPAQQQQPPPPIPPTPPPTPPRQPQQNPLLTILEKYGPTALTAALLTGAINYILNRRSSFQEGKIQEDEMMLIKNIMNKMANLPSSVVRRILYEGTSAGLEANYGGQYETLTPPPSPLLPPQPSPKQQPVPPTGLGAPQAGFSPMASTVCRKMLRTALDLYDYDKELADELSQTIIDVSTNEIIKETARNYDELGKIIAAEIKQKNSRHPYTKVAHVKAQNVLQNRFVVELLPYVVDHLPDKQIRLAATNKSTSTPESIIRTIIATYGPASIEPLYRIAKMTQEAALLPNIDINTISNIIDVISGWINEYGISDVINAITSVINIYNEKKMLEQKTARNRRDTMERESYANVVTPVIELAASVIARYGPWVAGIAKQVISWIIQHSDQIIPVILYIIDKLRENKSKQEIIQDIQASSEVDQAITAMMRKRQVKYAQTATLPPPPPPPAPQPTPQPTPQPQPAPQPQQPSALAEIWNYIQERHDPAQRIKYIPALLAGGYAGWEGGGALGRYSVSQDAIIRERRKQLREIIKREAPPQIRMDPVKLALALQMANMDLQQLAMLAAQIDAVAEQYQTYLQRTGRPAEATGAAPTTTPAEGAATTRTTSEQQAKAQQIDKATIEKQIKDLQAMYGQYADEAKRLKARMDETTNEVEKNRLRQEWIDTRKKLNDIHRTAEWLRYQYGDILRT